MKIGTGLVCAAAIASIAALVGANDGRTHDQRITTLEGQVSRLTATVTAQGTRIQTLEGSARQGSSTTPAPLLPQPSPAPSPPPAMASDTPTSPPVAPAPKSRTVYGTKTGSKYHGAGCSYLAKSAISMTLDEAISRGLTPCSRCGGR